MELLEERLAADLDQLVTDLALLSDGEVLGLITERHPSLRRRLDEAEAELGQTRQDLISQYTKWQAALGQLRDLWEMASWLSHQPEAPLSLKDAA